MLLLCNRKIKASRGWGTLFLDRDHVFQKLSGGGAAAFSLSQLPCMPPGSDGGSLTKEEPLVLHLGSCFGVLGGAGRVAVQFLPSTRRTKQILFVVFTAFLRLASAVPESSWDKQWELHGAVAFFARPPSSSWSYYLGFYSHFKMIFLLHMKRKKDQNHHVRQHLFASLQQRPYLLIDSYAWHLKETRTEMGSSHWKLC